MTTTTTTTAAVDLIVVVPWCTLTLLAAGSIRAESRGLERGLESWRGGVEEQMAVLRGAWKVPRIIRNRESITRAYVRRSLYLPHEVGGSY